MRSLTQDEILGSFVNATERERDRLAPPWWIDATPWDSCDYLGWADPSAPDRCYLVADTSFGLVGVVLRLPHVNLGVRRTLCNLCCTQHRGQGAQLMVARRSGKAGLNHNTVGTTMCADLSCSLYVRGLRRAVGAGMLPETLRSGERVARLNRNVEDFLGRVLVD